MKPISIGALARLSGVSERAIRLYEEHGLLYPQRTAGGRRTFSEADVRRLLNVVALRSLGCTLKEITGLAKQDAIDVTTVLGMWSESIAAQQARLAMVSQQLHTALEGVAKGEAMRLDALCSLLANVGENGAGAARQALVNRWFSSAEQATWKNANEKAEPAQIGGAQWSRLVRQAESAIERRIRPESVEGARIGARCAGLFEPLQASVGSGLWNRGATLMAKGELATDTDEAQHMRRVYDWLSRAVQHHRSRRGNATPATKRHRR